METCSYNVTLIMFLLLVLVRVSLQDSSAHSLRHLQLPVLAHTPHWILRWTLSLSDLHLKQSGLDGDLMKHSQIINL